MFTSGRRLPPVEEAGRIMWRFIVGAVAGSIIATALGIGARRYGPVAIWWLFTTDVRHS